MIQHDPKNPTSCYCPGCVCRNYPEIAKRHANCRMASEDVAYRKTIPEVVDRVIAGLLKPASEVK